MPFPLASVLDHAPWLDGILAAAAAHVEEAAAELAGAGSAASTVVPATDWKSSAARGFHERAEELARRLDALRIDVDDAAREVQALCRAARVAGMLRPL